ncbi:FG-GAP repeat domain-containing protein [Actinokineospora diospyrosa]|uniref:FG-GAP repeat domain-containing protein n=1 Tax=Actinokineospora diospyrosa TaxID=103728 RepID=UPI0020A45684|nr:VCBS repeat-containing protein [Actinokineospora diospyrosa]
MVSPSTPTSAGTVIPPTSANLRSFGAITWANPTTGSEQTDIYVATPAGELLVYQPVPSGILGVPRQAGNAGWQFITPIGLADWNHDNYPDLVARNDSTCNEMVYPGSPTGFGLPTQIGTGWCGYTFYGITDWTRDGHHDIIAVDSGGTQWVYPGDLTGGTATRIQIGTGWSSDLTPWGIADFNGDNHPDIITRQSSTSQLRMYPGDNTGTGNGAGTVIGSGFTGATFFGFTKYYVANQPLAMLTRFTGTLTRYTTNGAGGWSNGTGTAIATGW